MARNEKTRAEKLRALAAQIRHSAEETGLKRYVEKMEKAAAELEEAAAELERLES
jgi:hypothetical protein